MFSTTDASFLVGAFSSHTQATEALQELTYAKFEARRLSIAGPWHASDRRCTPIIDDVIPLGGPRVIAAALHGLRSGLLHRIGFARATRMRQFVLIYQGWPEDAACARAALGSAKATAATPRGLDSASAVRAPW